MRAIRMQRFVIEDVMISAHLHNNLFSPRIIERNYHNDSSTRQSREPLIED